MTNFQRTPCRCRRCDVRKTLPRHPDNYIRVPKCFCGSDEWRVDYYRIHTEWGVKGCDCQGYEFPHRRGGGWCLHNPELDLSNDHQYREFCSVR